MSDSAREKLMRAPALEVLAGEPLRAQRRRLFGKRGVFRLLIPRAIARVENGAVTARPDALAWFMLVMCAGGVIVELTMDRVRYPREYPPEFIFILSAAFTAATIWETRRVKRLVERALTARDGA